MDLPTYTNIWRIEKRLYKLYDLRLPMPLPLVQIGVFAGIFFPWIAFLYLVGVPFQAPWHVVYLVPPGVLTWLATRPVIESKRLTELAVSHARYLTEPRTWCRLTPIREPAEVTVVARVWHRHEPVAQGVAPPLPAPQGGRVPVLAAAAQATAAPATAGAAVQAPGRVAAQAPAAGARQTAPHAPTPTAYGKGSAAAARGPAAASRPPAHGAPSAPSATTPDQRARQGAVAPPSFGDTVDFSQGAPRPLGAGRAREPEPRPAAARRERAKPQEFAPPNFSQLPAKPADKTPPKGSTPAPGATPPGRSPVTPAHDSSPSAGAAPPGRSPVTPAKGSSPWKPSEVAGRATPAPDSRQAARHSEQAQQRPGSEPRPGRHRAPEPAQPAGDLPPGRSLETTQPSGFFKLPLGSPPDTGAPKPPERPGRTGSHEPAGQSGRTPTSAPPPAGAPPAYVRDQRSGPASPIAPGGVPPESRRVAPPPAEPAPPTPSEPSGGGLRRIFHAVGGNGHGEANYEERIQTTFQGARRIVVLGCTGGAGQTVTALMLGHTFAQHRGDKVVAVDGNPGPGALARRTRNDTRETLTSLLTHAKQVTGYPTMRRYTSQAKSGLEVLAAGKNPVQALDDRDYAIAVGTLDRFYSLTLFDTAAAVVARVLPHADQIVLVAPASGDAARAVAMTFEWLDGHGYEDLRSRAVAVVNGVSRRSMDDVEQAEAVARGRCRALVRIPWDDHLSLDRAPRNELKALRTPTRRAYVALAGVVASGLVPVPERYQQQEASRQ